MALELEVCTGILTYRDVEFSYMFDGEELRLIPPKEKCWEVEGW